MDSESFDDHLDGLNDYNIFYGYFHDLGLVTENKLLFHGDVEFRAKKYDDKSLPDYDDLYSPFDFSDDELDAGDGTHHRHEATSSSSCHDFFMTDAVKENHSNGVPSVDEARILDQERTNNDDESEATIQYVSSSSNSSFPDTEVVSNIHNNILSNTIFHLANYAPKMSNVTTFQQPRESRMKYLLRYMKIYQEFFNSGDLDKLKILNDDVLAKDCVLINLGNAPLIGRDKYTNVIASMLRNIPDYCVFKKIFTELSIDL